MPVDWIEVYIASGRDADVHEQLRGRPDFRR